MSASIKATLLSDFIESNKHLPAQGTEEWLHARLNRIGGSELASVLKVGKKSPTKLIAEKLGFDRFVGNTITHWGNIFEELIRLFTERKFNCDIKETGSIPYNHGFLSYSPDGVALVDKQSLSTQLEALGYSLDSVGLNDDQDFLTLFEFKCPHMRIVTNEIPEHYRPQITVGMNIINIMEVGIFIQAVYRRCNFLDIAYNAMHNSSGHFTKGPAIGGNPLETGFMVLWSDDEEYVHSTLDIIDQAVGISTVNGVYDLGTFTDDAENKDYFEQVLRGCVNKSISIDYSNRYEYNADIFDAVYDVKMAYNVGLRQRVAVMLDKAIEQYGSRIIGILPYKLMGVAITPVRKQHDFIDASGAYTKSKAVVDCLNDLRAQNITDKKLAQAAIRKYKL